jgi:hypothetical protein
MANIIIHVCPVITMFAEGMKQRVDTSMWVYTTMEGFNDVIVLCRYAAKWWGRKWTYIKNRKAIINTTFNNVEWSIRLASDAGLPP